MRYAGYDDDYYGGGDDDEISMRVMLIMMKITVVMIELGWRSFTKVLIILIRVLNVFTMIYIFLSFCPFICLSKHTHTHTYIYIYI